MAWTTTPPKVPGWWWVQCFGKVPQVVNVIVGRQVFVEFACRPMPELLRDMPSGTRWAGPIPEPQEPAS